MAGLSPTSFSATDIALASIVLVMDAALSVAMRLQFHRALLIAAVRMAIQLVALGLILRTVFAADAAWLTVVLVGAMALAAAREAAARPRERLARGHFLVSFVAVAAPSLLTCLFAMVALMPRSAGWQAQLVVPVAGILLGNVLNAVCIGLSGVLDGVRTDAGAIEARLTLGHSFAEAARPLGRRAVRQALVPLVNQMSAAGIITMPGIMTGQVLAGMDPFAAATYQIVLMLLLAGGSGLAAIIAVRTALRRLTDDRQRLRLDQLRMR